MSEQLITPLMMILIGSFLLYRNITIYRDDAKLRKYLETSRKAKKWVAKFGMDRTAELSKKYFLPLGILIAFVLIGAGLYGFIKPYL